ncbi:antibiotic biosynthesis monooxygenase [Streptomyces sp. CB03911]|uniref:putative quinol monooxygenase n=1 Tax=Streptomyces sp. CB03911 TaxID=1804758 RepID=UPI00093CDDE1|nr:antibiotic biosynthesis monooxygenase [Streptomyces sp. CB03911]
MPSQSRRGRALLPAPAEALVGIRAYEPGTLVYVSYRVPEEPRVRVFYQLYAHREAFEKHEEQPYVQHFLAERGQYLESFEVTFLDEVAGKRPAEAGDAR